MSERLPVLILAALLAAGCGAPRLAAPAPAPLASVRLAISFPAKPAGVEVGAATPVARPVSFRVERLDLTAVARFDVRVTGPDLGQPLTPSPNPVAVGAAPVALSVPAGRNRVFFVKGQDLGGAALAGVTVGALADVLAGPTQTVAVGMGSTPTALAAQALLDAGRNDLLAAIPAQELQRFVDRITQPSNGGASFQVAPGLVDARAIANAIVAAGGLPPDPAAPAFRLAPGTVSGRIDGLANGDRPQVAVGDPASAPVLTDAQGNFVVTGVAPGSWPLLVATDYYQRPVLFPSVTVAAGQTVGQTMALVVDNYFGRVNSGELAVNPAGGLARWTVMPIRMYLSTPADPAAVEFTATHRQAVQYAVNAWNAQAADVLRVEEVQDPNIADITVMWQKSLGGNTAGYTTLTGSTGTDLRVQMVLGTYFGDPSRGKQPELVLKQVATHELGHSLGLWAHSDVTTDLMFPFTDGRINLNISRRDLNTLRQLYHTPQSLTRSP